jgi:hypothetical protein
MVAIVSPVLLDLVCRRRVGPAMRPERQTLQKSGALCPSDFLARASAFVPFSSSAYHQLSSLFRSIDI